MTLAEQAKNISDIQNGKKDPDFPMGMFSSRILKAAKAGSYSVEIDQVPYYKTWIEHLQEMGFEAIHYSDRISRIPSGTYVIKWGSPL